MPRSAARALAALLALAALPVAADEGMWTFDDFPAEKVATELGAEIDQQWLDRVRLATTRLEGGCTGSFVSPHGLVLTNNHCTWGCIRDLSSAERNLSETGFYAASPDEELVCPGARISVLVETVEVTGAVTAATEGLDEAAANEARKRELTRLEEACEEASRGELKCESVALYHGGQHWLHKYRRYDDVRLVFAPELAIAAFGGDPDNFDFPRYCLDMSFLRAYEDGEPAETPHHLPWRVEGPDEGEPVFVAGHPGSTQRLLTIAELEQLRNDRLPKRLLVYSELRGRLHEWGKTGAEPARIAQQRMLGIENAIKVWRNQLFALLDPEPMAAKHAAEETLRAAVAADPHLAAAYADAWSTVERALAEWQTFADRYRFLEDAMAFQGQLFSWARTVVRGAEERPKPSQERLREFRDTRLPAIESRLLAEIPTDPGYERLRLAFSLAKMQEWLGPDEPMVRSVLGSESPENLAEALVAGTGLAEVAERRRLWEGGAEAVAASDDPLILLARRVDDEARAVRRRYEDSVEAPLDAASEKIARARFAILGTSVYPDATFTLRTTYGTVRGWEELGSPVEPFTVLETLYERATGAEPFALPESWIDAEERLDPGTRVNLVADTDIIGGNSGSPMVDAKGRIVGLVFDGNLHSIAGSFWFDRTKNRTVAVHPAFMAEALREVYGTERLIEELGLGDE